MTTTTEGIVLHYNQYREHDRVYTIYTKDFGKVALLARGSNKIKSKLAGHLEPCIFSSLMIASGKGFDILAQARTIDSFVDIRENYDSFSLTAILLEAMDKLTHDEEEDPELYELLLESLASIRTMATPAEHLDHFIPHTLLHLLIHLGHAPDLTHEHVLEPLLVARPHKTGIIVSNEAKGLIFNYLIRALDEKRMFTMDHLYSHGSTI